MKATDLKQKLEIIYNLFQPVIEYNGKPIDSERQKTYYGYGKLTRAYSISYNYLYYDITPNKSDMLYVNNIVSKLISLLGTDISIIDRDYIKTKLNTKQPVQWNDWITHYKKLLNFIRKT